MKRKLVVFAAALAAATAFLLVSVRPWDDGTTASNRAGTEVEPTSTAAVPSATTTPTTSPGSDPATTEPGTAEPGATVESGPSIDLATSPLPPSTALRARVTRLADGDSFEVDWIDPPPPDIGRAEVRMLGINAPEAQACFGSDARLVLQDLIGGREILVEIVETENGGFGRQISNVWAGGELLNLRMVEAGAALSLSGDGTHAPLIAAAQAEALQFGRGLWTECGADANIAIIDLQSDAPGRDDFNQNGEWIEVGNFGDVALDLTNWGIRDESTRHRYRFPAGFVLEPGELVRIGSGCDWHDNDEDVELFWCASDPVWNNTGDTAFLVDATGRFVDQWSYDG